MTARWKPIGYLSVTALAVLVAVSAFAISERAVRSSSAHSSRAERVVIGVEGMYCDSCAAGIKSMLKRTSGVVAADVSYQRKEAVVDYDPEKITPEKIVETINNLGYKAKIKS